MLPDPLSQSIHLLWAVGYAYSSSISAFAATYDTALKLARDLAHGKIRDGFLSAGAAAYDKVLCPYATDIATAIRIALGREHAVAPEAFGMTEVDWDLMANATTQLEAYANFKASTQRAPPPPPPTDVFLPAARVLTVASTLSYADESEAKHVLQAVSKRHPSGDIWDAKLVDISNAQVMLFVKSCTKPAGNPVIIVAFRGTELPDENKEGWREFWPDWLRNVRLLELPVGFWGKEAHGFHLTWINLKDRVLSYIKAVSCSCDDQVVDVYVTGHSAGAALAGASLIDLIDNQAKYSFRVRGCITLAQPRFCDGKYAISVAKKMASAGGVPLDTLANEDVTGVDPVVSLGDVFFSKTPPGRMWKVRVDQATKGPLSDAEHKRLVCAPMYKIARRCALSVSLHWPGGRVGYLNALAT